MNDRIETGITGLDKLIEGGFPRGSLVLLAGSPGSGKTIASAQFLYHGVADLGEPAVYVSFAERKEVFFNNMEQFGFTFRELERKGKFKFLDMMTSGKEAISATLEMALEEVHAMKAKRLVIDSFSAMALTFDKKIEARIILHMLEKVMRSINCTTLLLVEIPTGQSELGLGFEEFVSDGIILFQTTETRAGIQKRSIIRKMRGTKHNQNYHNIIISDEGLSLMPYMT
ncbi:MAG TPA: ATPase domain-containing protein [Candidatus Bathyarchaeia archaeon]|nr:ATPase domain-containing protein [Candidatus Bathyarchaeia archaeon]